MATYQWVTEKGANVEVEIIEVKEIVNADGHEVETKNTHKQIEKFTVNGNEYKADLMGDQIVFWIGKQRAAAVIPAEISQQIHAAEIAADKKAITAEKSYMEHYNKVVKAMEE